MHEILAQAAAELDLAEEDLAALRSASTLGSQRTEQARARLSPLCVTGLDLVAFGSHGRQEVTAESDFDYLVLATELPQEPAAARRLLGAADQLRTEFAMSEGQSDSIKAPGASGIFGTVVGAFDLIQQIGLQYDTNHSLTRRMLLLEESVSFGNPEVHERVMRATLDRYLTVTRAPAEHTPRFLLNDVIRYWRTITVDYQAKALDGGRSISGLRYLKLIISRKVVYAATLMSLLYAEEQASLATVDHLYDQFTMPPLARLVGVYPHMPPDVRLALAEILRIVNRFLDRSGDSEWRDAVNTVGDIHDESVPEFTEMRGQARTLQQSLETVFFDWEELGDKARHYLAF